MKIARGKLHINAEKLREMLDLPNDVEVFDIKPSLHGGYEVLLISAGEVFVGDLKVTHENISDSTLMRRVSVDTLKEARIKEMIDTMNKQGATIIPPYQESKTIIGDGKIYTDSITPFYNGEIKTPSTNENKNPTTYVINVTVGKSEANAHDLAQKILKEIKIKGITKGIN
jgi:hypothetical protein